MLFRCELLHQKTFLKTIIIKIFNQTIFPFFQRVGAAA
jgi:hypothetical protein